VRWVTYESTDGQRVGVIDGDRVMGLPGERQAAGSSLLDLLAAGPEAMAAAALAAKRSPSEVSPLDTVVLAAPLPRPPSVRDAVGFLDHIRGIRRALGVEEELPPVWSEIPAFYFANAAAVVGPREPVCIPPGCQWFDFELEVGAVIGKPGRDIHPDDGEFYIAGYTLYCDWSNRDVQAREMQLGIGQGKAKDMAITLGPSLVTTDELEDYRRDGRLSFGLVASVNGRELTHRSLDQMDWSFAELVAYASRGADLKPGDVIGSGTVPGGCLFEHLDTPNPAEFQGWLKPGDEVSLQSDALGMTRQTVLPTIGNLHRLHSGF
jgi:2-keto-4-pentenoate hydratase/2-oxohepta-3-ene-1,7-dioic acid hydratase in catechol pathway